MIKRVFLGFGANLGDRPATLKKALRALDGLMMTRVVQVSGLYETKPVGLKDNGPDFINAAIELETELDPHELITGMRRIEVELGKSRDHTSDSSRVIDLDLLLYNNWIINEDYLEAPHPRMTSRAFVLVPLADIAANVVHPALRMSIKDLLGQLSREELESVKSYGATPPGL
jgi:2-amino-4-hydroxy-6-hydroxymethyldihydropteridine diphosphokinase